MGIYIERYIWDGYIYTDTVIEKRETKRQRLARPDTLD